MTLPHSLDILDYPARFQFGQPNAPCGGRSCCTDTDVQMIGEYYKEKTYSLAKIRQLAQAKTHYNENPCTGINAYETLNALSAMGITWYRGATNINASFVATKLEVGPVLVGVAGESYPNDLHGHCGSTNKAAHGGRTQCSFRGPHAILVVGKQKENGVWYFITRDSNHNSPSRPEEPKFDKITLAQLNKAISDLPKKTAFNTTFCLYSIKRKKLDRL